MSAGAKDLAASLARHAEAVCRHYLPSGRRYGGYWIVGDVRNASGRSTYVRLKPKGSDISDIGRWTDAATGEHGDLLDVIRGARGLDQFCDVAEEARRFLLLPRPPPSREDHGHALNSPPRSSWSAKRFLKLLPSH